MKCDVHWCNADNTGNSRWCAVHQEQYEQQDFQRGVAMDIAFESLNKGPAIFGGRNPLHAMANTFKDITTPSDAVKNRPTYADAKAKETPPSGPNWFERAGQRLTDFGDSTEPLTGRVGSVIQAQEDRRDIFDNPKLSVDESRAAPLVDTEDPLSSSVLNPVKNIGGALGAAAMRALGSSERAVTDDYGPVPGKFHKPKCLIGALTGVKRNVLKIPDHRKEAWFQRNQERRRKQAKEKARATAPDQGEFEETGEEDVW